MVKGLKALANNAEFWLRFLEALKHDVKMPRVSVELVYDVLLFPEVLEALMRSELELDLQYVTKEFPIRKYRLGKAPENYASNISVDFLMVGGDTLYLVELKTEMDSKGKVQEENYTELKKKAERDKGLLQKLLVDDYKMVRAKTKDRVKYEKQYEEFSKVLTPELCGRIEKIEVIYIQPVNDNKDDSYKVVSLNDFANKAAAADSDIVKGFKTLWLYTQGQLG